MKNKILREKFKQIFYDHFHFPITYEMENALDNMEKVFADERTKLLELLDKAELERWFDMPDSTENWRTWKRIRNAINSEVQEMDSSGVKTMTEVSILMDEETRKLRCAHCNKYPFPSLEEVQEMKGKTV